MISDVKNTDEGTYECKVYGDASKVQSQHLIVIEGPTSVQILNKENNRLLGTEGKDFNIRCTANGGDPAPNMVLMIGSESYTSRNTHTIDHTTTRVSRSYDGVNVTCQAGYDGVTYTPLTDTAVIRLDLKPLPPAFNINQVVTENTKTLVITCTSTGSRPAPSDRIWLIGNSNQDITSSSTAVSSALQPDDTYTATSTLTYKVPKDYNQHDLTCGFKNIVTGNNFIQIKYRINVLYAPSISVQNRTFSLTQTVREVYCNIDGKPNSTFIKWQHKSKYGVMIREFDQGSTLILRKQTEDNRYQDTGEYVCITSNGIQDEFGNLNQSRLGFVVSEAPPLFALYNRWTQGIQLKPSRAPDQPKNLTVIGQTVDSLTVQWIEGFDGGLDQTFYIMYSQQGTGRWTTVMGPKGVRGGTGKVQQTVIRCLQHSTVYVIKMFAKNQINTSAETMIKIGSTLSMSNANNVAALEMENDTLKGAAAGISVVTVISIIFNMVFAYKCIADRRKPRRSHKEQPGSDTNDMGCYDNIPDIVDENSLVDDAKYESLDAKNKPNVYDDFGKNRGDAQCTLYSNTVV